MECKRFLMMVRDGLAKDLGGINVDGGELTLLYVIDTLMSFMVDAFVVYRKEFRE